MASTPSAPSSLCPSQGPTARLAPISWRNVAVLKDARRVSGSERMKALSHLRNHGRLPDGYTFDLPAGWSVDFLGFDDDTSD